MSHFTREWFDNLLIGMSLVLVGLILLGITLLFRQPAPQGSSGPWVATCSSTDSKITCTFERGQ